MSNVLDKIVAQTWLTIERSRAATPLEQVQRQAAQAADPLDFYDALDAGDSVQLIAEVKKASPSAGLIREDFQPRGIAEQYAAAGAACISVLTDEPFFQGQLQYLREIRAAVSVPLLRKDFIVDPYQVYEARAAGADAILLIAECLTAERLIALHQLARQLGMATLIELYEPENLPHVLATDCRIIGVNNRDLRTFQTDLQHTVRMREAIPRDRLLVGESGIRSREDVLALGAAGVKAILVGESLMRQADLSAAVKQLTGCPAVR
ncbi:indole-3-glycerol phosphate synthase TrpC [Roseimaritima ulvae]|uniref:Indole-3-glycerol phosphate synthase n=1 Tax=Roseimaritima ulvae TaxID=980254 RepID=A0A5B9R0A8_9BACT|nr:indole-3-glycerol phosphate synthase TrpC [Roseimaritima ulvae]QEG39713.1 Indole-3-glycerol phosphate synthase [Roseimaritima ulvae]